jgi:hypothetical protein
LNKFASLNKTLISLHDQLKALILSCSQDFPQDVKGGPALLEEAAQLQTAIAAYARELLVQVFECTHHDATNAPCSPGAASKFLRLWHARAGTPNPETRSEQEIDRSVRDLVAILTPKMVPMSERELREAVEDDDMPEMLYYLSTLQESLGWYIERYLSRLVGQLG